MDPFNRSTKEKKNRCAPRNRFTKVLFVMFEYSDVVMRGEGDGEEVGFYSLPLTL